MNPTLEPLLFESKQQSFSASVIYAKRFDPFWHYHPELELTLITRGQGTRFVGDNISPFKDNDLVLVGENLPHHWVSRKTDMDKPVSAVVIQFPKFIFNAFPECRALTPLLEKAAQGIRFLNPSQSLLRSLTTLTNLPTPLQLSRLITVLHTLSLDEQQEVLSSKVYKQGHHSLRHKTKVSKCTSFILEHLHKKLTVPQMAEQFHMTTPSFCRWFKKHVGLSFVTFLNQSRVESACHYLATTDKQIQDIAFTVGFESLSQFNRTFKRFKEVSPSIFRKRL